MCFLILVLKVSCLFFVLYVDASCLFLLFFFGFDWYLMVLIVLLFCTGCVLCGFWSWNSLLALIC